MWELFKNTTAYVAIAGFVYFSSMWLESGFVVEFLSGNLITILIALLAINITTSSIVMTKLRELADENGTNFSPTIGEFEKSNLQQIFHIIASILILILLHSKKVSELNFPVQSLLEWGLIFIFILSLVNLYDTGRSIFVIMKHEKNNV